MYKKKAGGESAKGERCLEIELGRVSHEWKNKRERERDRWREIERERENERERKRERERLSEDHEKE